MVRLQALCVCVLVFFFGGGGEGVWAGWFCFLVGRSIKSSLGVVLIRS